MRELMPRTPFLLPGIGAQGGERRRARAGLRARAAPAASSAPRARSPTRTRQPAATPADAARAEAERLREQAWAL